MDKFRLDGKVAIITGGGSGIGRCTAKVLAEAGAKVFIGGRREDRLIQVKEEIEAASGECGYLSVDLSKEEECKKLVDACVAKYGRLDVLANVAGIAPPKGSLDMMFDTETFEKAMGCNFNSTLMMCKYAYPEMAKNNAGSIINFASMAILKSSGILSYGASKGAVRGLSFSLAPGLGAHNIRVNTIYPGVIRTDMTAHIVNDPEYLKNVTRNPLHCVGEPEDIAYCVQYLASDAARFITGADFVVDGGITIV